MTKASKNRLPSYRPVLAGIMLIGMLCAIILYVWLAYQLAILIVLMTGIRGQMEYAILALVGGAAFLIWRIVGLKLWRRGIALLERISDPAGQNYINFPGDDS